MKHGKIFYWITTSFVGVLMMASAVKYFIGSDMAVAYKHLGFPDHLRIEIGIAKIIGAIVLLTPRLPVHVKEWSYAGFAILFFNASFAHFFFRRTLNGSRFEL